MLKKAPMKFDKELFKGTVLNNIKTLYRRTLEELPDRDISNMLNWRAVGALRQPPDALRKGVGAMVTYSELFQFVIMLCAVVTLVIYITRKK